MDTERIKRQARQILDKFAKALEKVEKEIKEESYVDREEFERVEGIASSLSKDNEKSKNSNFKKELLENAPNHDDDFIIAEKGEWK